MPGNLEDAFAADNPTSPIQANGSSLEDQFQADINTAHEQAVRGSIQAGATSSPDRAARVQQVGKLLALPPEIVEPNLDALEGRARFEAVPFAHLIEHNPRLASWLSDRNNAAIGHDDIPALVHLDNAARILAAPVDQPAEPDTREALPWWPGVIGRYARRNFVAGGDVLLGIPAVVEMAARERLDMPLTSDSPAWTPAGAIATAHDALASEERAAQTYHESVAQKATGGLWEMLANPIASVAPILGAEAGLAGALAKGASAAVTGLESLTGASLVALEQTSIATLADGMSRQQATRQPGQSGWIMPTGRDVANAAVQGALAYLGGQAMGLRGILRGFNPEPITAGVLAADMGIQGSVMAAQGAAGALASGLILDGKAPGLGDLGEAAVIAGAGGAAMALGFGSFHYGAQELHARIVDSANAIRAADIMAKLGAPLADSKAFKRNGDRVVSLLQDAIGNGDGVTYHQADGLGEIAAAAGIPPQVLYDRLGITADALAESKATHAPLPVDVAKILGEAAKGGPKAVAALLDNFQASPALPSLKQAAAFAKTLPEEIAKLKADAEASTAAGRTPTPADRVYADVYNQLIATGHDHAFADKNAAQWRNHYGAIAFWYNREHGAGYMDAHSEYMRKPLRLVNALPESLTNPKSKFGQKLDEQRAARTKKWAAEDASAAKLDAAQATRSADEAAAAAKLTADAAGKPGQDIIDQALAILADESKKTGRIMLSGDVTAALGLDFGLKADSAIKLSPEQTARGDLFAKAMRSRGHTLDSLGVAGAQRAGAELRKAEIAAVPKIAADSPETTQGIADAIALKDLSLALRDTRLASAMPDELFAQKTAEAAALAKKLAPIVDSLPLPDDLRAEVESAIAEAGGTLNQPAWHGTGNPDPYDRFRYDRVGGPGGEGAQAFGHGLYFTGKKEIGEWYKNTLGAQSVMVDGVRLTGNTPDTVAARLVLRHGSVDAAIESVTSGGPKDPAAWRAAGIEALRGKRVEAAGKLYSVEIPDDHEMLSWDKAVPDDMLDKMRDNMTVEAQRALPARAAHVVKDGNEWAVVANWKSGEPVTIGKYPSEGLAERVAISSIRRPSGEELYNKLSFALGRDPRDPTSMSAAAKGGGGKLASDALRDAGIPGIRYLAGEARGKGEGVHNYVIFDDSRIKIQSYEQNEGPVRGSYEPASNTIKLFKAENRSTFAHETGHAFLTHMEDLAARPDAPATIKDDFAKIRAYVGAEGEHTGFTREQHEKWARSWEGYLMEGKAPSPALAGPFARFRTWLTSIYKSAAGLSARAGQPIELSPEIRSVMDRMLATEDEIQMAQAQQAQAALFGDAKIADEAKMSPEERAAYSAAVARATQAAEAKVFAEQMAEETRRRKAEGSVAYKAIREEVTTEVDDQPVYAALRALRDRVTGPGGERIPGLDRDAIAHMYADSTLPAERQMAMRLGALKTLADKGQPGVHPDLIAPLFGFDSGDALVHALVSARGRESLIAEQAKQRFQEQHPDLQPTAGGIAEQAMRAVHGSARADVLRLEVQKLGQRIGKQPAAAEVLRKIATDRVGKTKVADLRPDLYRAAEAKAARRAFEAATKGEWATAFEEKQREWLNYELTRACQDAKDRSVQMRQDMLDLTTPAAQQRIGKAGGWEWSVIAPDGAVIARPTSQAEADAIMAQRPDAKLEQTSGFQEQINAILDRFDLKPISAAQAQRRRSLSDWAAMMADQGFQVDLPAAVTSDLRPSWKAQTVDELAEVHDAVVQIEHLAMQQNKLLAINDKVTFAHARDALVASIHANARETRSTKSGKDPLDGVRNGIDGMIGSLERLGDIVLRLDGDKPGGAMWDTLKRPFDQAANVEAAKAAKTTAELHEALATWEAAGGRGRGRDAYSKLYIPEIGESLSRLERILVALNWGNEGNRERLLVGSGWEEHQALAVLKTLDKADAALVQAIAKIINTHWPDIAAKQRRVFGVVPEKVEGASFELAGEQIEGFYFPIVADPTKSSEAAQRSLAQIADDMRRGAYTAASTQRNHTKARVGPSGERLDLSLSVVSRHLNKVFHDLTHHETLIDANRLLRDKAVVGAIEAHYGPKMVATINDAMVRIAGATIREVDGMEHVVKVATRNVGRAAMAYQVWTAVQGIVGITQSMERVGILRYLQAMAPVTGDAGAMQSLGSYVHGMSDYMARKYKMSGENMAEETATGMGVIGRDLPDALRPYAMMEGIQRLVDYPTWKAAYDHAVELGNDPKPNGKAVLMADQAVVDSQTGKDIKDKAAVLEGNQYKKLMTMFYGYFNGTFNMTRRSVKRTDFTSPKDVALLARSFALLYAIPTALTVAGMALLRPDKKRDGHALPGRLSAETLAMMMATVPIVRELSAGAKGLFGDGTPYSGPASMRGLDTINMLLSQMGGAAHGKGEHLGKAAAQTAGLISGLPTVQLQRTLDGLLYDIDRKTPNPIPVLFGKPR